MYNYVFTILSNIVRIILSTQLHSSWVTVRCLCPLPVCPHGVISNCHVLPCYYNAFCQSHSTLWAMQSAQCKIHCSQFGTVCVFLKTVLSHVTDKFMKMAVNAMSWMWSFIQSFKSRSPCLTDIKFGESKTPGNTSVGKQKNVTPGVCVARRRVTSG